MKHPLSIAVLAALALAGVTTAVAASADTPATSSTTLTFKQTSVKNADTGHKGPSIGDMQVVRGSVFKTDGKTRVGSYEGTCSMIAPDGSTTCTFIIGRPEGQLVISAAYGKGYNEGSTAHEAIVGGTGAYSNAHGEVLDHETGRKTATATIELAN